MPEKFEERLRKARVKKGLSQAELAEKAGFQPSAVSHFETGARSPSFENLKRLADALGVSIDHLLGRKTQVSSAGPVADKLFRNFDRANSEDQETIANFAEMLAKKNRAGSKDDKD